MSDFWPDPTVRDRAAYADAVVRPYWLDRLPARDPHPPLRGRVDADLCMVGGGFTGLWAALHAKADDPARDVVVLEAETIGYGASGRNGGFLLGSLTHGIANGLARFGDEMAVLERLGHENLAGLRADLDRHGIDCDLELTGDLVALLEPYQDEWIEEEVALLRAYGHDVEVLDGAGDAGRGPLADLPRRDLGPHGRGRSSTRARLVDGLRAAAERLGVRIFEGTRAEALRRRCAGAARSRSRRPAGACARAASCSRRARSRRSCARSVATSCRSTTTRS